MHDSAEGRYSFVERFQARHRCGTRPLAEESSSNGVLTLNGRAEMVVQDAASYQATLDALERAEAKAGIRRGLQAVAEGRTRPALR